MNRVTADRPVSTQTFGPIAENTYLQAPTPQRAPSIARPFTPEVEMRPSLIRSQTPTIMEDQKEIARMFSENMFADPTPQKVLKFGPKLFSDGHQRLIFMLREECGRLYSFNKQLKNRVLTSDRAVKQMGEQVADLKSSLHGKSERLVAVTNELREAQDIIREMDADLERTRNKRLSRINPRNDDDSFQLGEYAS